MKDQPLTIMALPVLIGITANVWGLVSGIRITNVEDAMGGAWNIVGWCATLCYAAMLSLCLFMQGMTFSFGTTESLPAIIQATSMAFGVMSIFTGLLTVVPAVISLPVLLATLVYIGFKKAIRPSS